MENILFKETDISESYFLETKLKNIDFDESILKKSEIINTPLASIDFSNSNIEEIKIDLFSIKGLIVNMYQAIDLAKYLGIIIKY